MNGSIGINDTPSDILAFLENHSDRLSSEAKGMKVYHLSVWEEVVGTLFNLEQSQYGGLVALVGKIFVALPEEMATRLTEAKGQRVGVLRTDSDYRFRVITAMKSDRDSRSSSLSIAQDAL